MSRYLGSVFNNVKEFYNEINAATLTGAIDVVVVEQADGSFTCSPFHVRFGKLGVLRSRLKVVDLELNGEPLNIHMKLGESGEAFFVEEVPENEVESSAHLATSPIPDSGFNLYQEQMLSPRRTSTTDFSLDKYQNQVSDYTQRRYTDGENSKPNMSAHKREYQMLNKDFMYDYKPSQSSQDQEMFVMDGLRDQSHETQHVEISTPTPMTAKTFCAEELGDKESRAKDAVRKISMNNDFRPISIDKDEVSTVPSSEVKSNEELVLASAIEETPKIGNSTNNKKKKKTKKSGSKKKNSVQRKLSSSSNGYSSQSEALGSEVMESEKPEDKVTIEAADKNLIQSATFNVTDLTHDHFFSDTDILSSVPRRNSRPGSPVQSDSELELARGSGVQGSSEPGQSWRWGELPSPLPTAKSTVSLCQSTVSGSLAVDDKQTKSNSKDDVPINVASQTSKSSVFSEMFNFMKQPRTAGYPKSKNTAEGVYLAEIADGAIKPEEAALYFPSHSNTGSHSCSDIPRSLPVDISNAPATEEDYESGNGPSLPQSPSSIEGMMGKGIDSDEDDIKIFSKGYVGLSLCGPDFLGQSAEAVTEAFEREAIRFEMLCADPTLLQNPRLVVRIGERYMPWAAAAPTLMSLIVYHRPLPKNVKSMLQPSIDGKDLSSENKSEDGTQNIANKVQQPTGGFTWWSWRKSADKQTVEPVMKHNLDVVDGKETIKEQEVLSVGLDDEISDTLTITEIVSEEPITQESDNSPVIAVSTQTSLHSLTEIGGEGYSGSQSSEDSDEGLVEKSCETSQPKSCSSKHGTNFRKTLRLSSDVIASLNLLEGMNEMVFSVTTAYQGTSRCKCHVFRWRHNDKIVISDIDGTITKSDVLGHIFPLVGKDWAQSGVAQLFTKIKNNGYKLLYLSARAIGQAKGTREYLRSIKQGDLSLPDGPLLLNPTSLLRAFHREVIEKKPEEFKIQCLSDIKALFPEDSKPFYAGYGNRVNDVCAYHTVGIPIVRIFTINYKGELKHELTQTFQSSYSNMSYIVDHLFPPVQSDVCEDFSQFVYWRQPIADLKDIVPSASTNSLSTIPEVPSD